ncbi:hypothetical protein FRAAL2372 [Frankia alni ACN14a]|uniref:Uncharacterized protein n=1 Tax=Frankia alni (strain DSM 45986 / CECT 9034 / ACN14a) TaxID=326424 RepID=Q0RN69_FRAAA|nr:hypothetical protein FRAAL2372 [Frankia alni ACN14a]
MFSSVGEGCLFWALCLSIPSPLHPFAGSPWRHNKIVAALYRRRLQMSWTGDSISIAGSGLLTPWLRQLLRDPPWLTVPSTGAGSPEVSAASVVPAPGAVP